MNTPRENKAFLYGAFKSMAGPMELILLLGDKFNYPGKEEFTAAFSKVHDALLDISDPKGVGDEEAEGYEAIRDGENTSYLLGGVAGFVTAMTNAFETQLSIAPDDKELDEIRQAFQPALLKLKAWAKGKEVRCDSSPGSDASRRHPPASREGGSYGPPNASPVHGDCKTPGSGRDRGTQPRRG